jgi:hypothetical protein
MCGRRSFTPVPKEPHPLAKVAKTLGAYKTGLLNYFKHFIINGVVEGINNKIKTLKRQAYSFRDMLYFKLRLYHLHTQRYSLSATPGEGRKVSSPIGKSVKR